MVILLSCQNADACNVPVFRYALENWPLSPYRAVIIANKPLTSIEKAGVKELRDAASPTKGFLNLTIQQFNSQELVKTSFARSIGRAPKQKDVRLYLFYPVSTGRSRFFWSCSLNKETVKKIIDSPFRKTLVKKLLEGNSCVFVLLESGDKKEDDIVEEYLKKYLKKCKKTLKIPKGVVMKNGKVTGGVGNVTDAADYLKSDIPLKISFAVIRLPRKGTDDVFVNLCLNMEPRLSRIKGTPVLLTVYGRGRIIPPITDKKVTSEDIDKINTFITDPCSCQVKDMNPGFDLLIKHDWDMSVFKKRMNPKLQRGLRR